MPFSWSRPRSHQNRTPPSIRVMAIQPCAEEADGRAESQGVGLRPNYFSANFINQLQYARRRRRPCRPRIRRQSARTTGHPPVGRRRPRCEPGSGAQGRRDGGGEREARRRSRAPETPSERKGVRDQDRVSGVLGLHHADGVPGTVSSLRTQRCTISPVRSI